jgi:hypothetical protein
MSYYKEAIIKHIVTNVATEGKEKYQKFFNSALNKFGVKSPAELSDEKKKEFFNYIEKNYKAKNESTKEYAKSLEKIASDRKLKNISKKDKVLLMKLADMMKNANESIDEDVEDVIDKFNRQIKKEIMVIGKEDRKKATELGKLYKKYAIEFMIRAKKLVSEGVVTEEIDSSLAKYLGIASRNAIKMFKELERYVKKKDATEEDISSHLEDIYNKVYSMKRNVDLKESKLNELDWNHDMSRMSGEIDKVFRMAKIKVKKHIPYKRSFRTGDAALYGAFIHVKDKFGEETVLPIEIDKKGIITYAGGPNKWHKLEKIGALNMSHAKPDDYLKIKTYARTIDYLKQFAKLPGFGQSVLYRKEGIEEGITSAGYSELGKRGRYLPMAAKEFVKALKKQDDKEVISNIEYVYDLMNWMKMTLKLKKYNENKIKESTPFQMKTDAYTDALNALDKYASILDKVGSKKKSKFALKMLKSLQRNFFMKEIKGGPLGSVASSDIQDIRVNIGRLIGLANGSQADEVFSKIKPSKKALKAADKLIGKVS